MPKRVREDGSPEEHLEGQSDRRSTIMLDPSGVMKRFIGLYVSNKKLTFRQGADLMRIIHEDGVEVAKAKLQELLVLTNDQVIIEARELVDEHAKAVEAAVAEAMKEGSNVESVVSLHVEHLEAMLEKPAEGEINKTELIFKLKKELLGIFEDGKLRSDGINMAKLRDFFAKDIPKEVIADPEVQQASADWIAALEGMPEGLRSKKPRINIAIEYLKEKFTINND